jgi:hypothetical protein
MTTEAAGRDGLAPDEPTPWAAFVVGPTSELPPSPARLPSFRDLAIAAYREAEEAGGPTWDHAIPEERAAAVAGRILTVAGAAAQLEARGYSGAGAMARYLADMLAMAPDPRPGERPGETAGAIGHRTARDLRHGDAPPQLAGVFLTAEGPTVLYARGGTGKGLLACWFALQLVRAGHVVMVVDFEGHEMEWGSRLRGLGLTDDELGRIHYRAPFGTDWTAPTGSLAAVADAIRDDAARLGVTYLVVDSYSVATSNGDTMGGEAAAREYFSGLARIGLPSLTIAHVRGDSGKFPERPFGSVFVHNLARETWAVERIGDDDPDAIDPDEIRFGPYVVALELRNKKANARPKSAAQFVTFSFFADGTIEVVTDGPAGRSVADLAADALADGPLTLPKIAAAIKEDTGQVVSVENIRSALARHPRRFAQDKSGKRPYPWSVR